jgi:hypothetical protein
MKAIQVSEDLLVFCSVFTDGIEGRATLKIKIQNEKLKVAIQKSKFLQLPCESIQF